MQPKNNNKPAGMILIIVMLFVAILSLLIITLLQSNILETKISIYNKNLAVAESIAASNLLTYEKEILQGDPPAKYVHLIDKEDVCGVQFFEVTAPGTFGTSSVNLQSTFAKIVDNNCSPKPVIQGRLSWKMIYFSS